MEPLLEKPPGSSIRESHLADGVRLHWQHSDSAGMIQRTAILVFMLAWITGWAFGEVTVIRTLIHSHSMSGVNALGTVFMVFWLLGWSFGGLMAILITVFLAIPQRPESVTLLPSRFQYRPGNFATTLKRDPIRPPIPLRDRKLMRKRIDLEKSEIIEFGFEDIDGEPRLFITDRTGRTQIGQYLEPPDREWLYVVLEEWRQRR